MKRLLVVAVVVLLGGCVSDGGQAGVARGPVGANSAASAGDVALWTPKPGLVATVIVMEPEKFDRLADTVRPDLRNRPVSGLAYFAKTRCIVWLRANLKPTEFRHTLAHELRHCQAGQFHKD